MQITRRADYGVRTVLDVASLEPDAMGLTHEIAARQSIPLPFLAKIIPALTRAGIVRSYRGAGGGLTLARPAAEITLLDVVEAVDGPIALNSCVLYPDECPRSGTCPVHGVWCEAQQTLASQLRAVTIASLLSARDTETLRHGDAETRRHGEMEKTG